MAEFKIYFKYSPESGVTFAVPDIEGASYLWLCSVDGVHWNQTTITKRENRVGDPDSLIGRMYRCAISINGSFMGHSDIAEVTKSFAARAKYGDWIHTADVMEGAEFEQMCAEVLEKNGYKVEVTKTSGDYGIDILAEKDKITYAIQCKRYSEPVGIKAVQEASAGRLYYGKMVAVVMTNNYFTPAAVLAADKALVALWDRDDLIRMTKERQ